MNRSGYRLVIGLLLATAAAVAVGFAAYDAGVARGLAEAGRAAAGNANAPAPYVYVWPRPWGFGFFPFFPFLFIFLWFVTLRSLLWRGWRGRGWWQDGGVPPRFEEWHRRAHEQEAMARREAPHTNSELRTSN